MLKSYICMFEHTLFKFVLKEKVGSYLEGVERGRVNSTRVPWFSFVVIAVLPSCVLMIDWTIARPKPVPLPLGLVVKYG